MKTSQAKCRLDPYGHKLEGSRRSRVARWIVKKTTKNNMRI